MPTMILSAHYSDFHFLAAVDLLGCGEIDKFGIIVDSMPSCNKSELLGKY